MHAVCGGVWWWWGGSTGRSARPRGHPQPTHPPTRGPLAPPRHPCLDRPWQEWQTGKQSQHSAAVGQECNPKGGDAPGPTRASGLRGGAPPGEFSFPPDAGSCGLSIGMTDGGVRPPPSKAARPWRWRWRRQPYCYYSVLNTTMRSPTLSLADEENAKCVKTRRSDVMKPAEATGPTEPPAGRQAPGPQGPRTESPQPVSSARRR